MKVNILLVLIVALACCVEIPPQTLSSVSSFVQDAAQFKLGATSVLFWLTVCLLPALIWVVYTASRRKPQASQRGWGLRKYYR